MFNKNDALRKRADLRDKIAMVQANAKKQNRELTDTDNVIIDANLAEISALNSALDRHEAGAYFPASGETSESAAIIRGIVGAGAHEARQATGEKSVKNLLRSIFQNASAEEQGQITDLASYMRGRPMAGANLTPGSDGGVLIP